MANVQVAATSAPARGRATRGRVARAVSGVTAIEVKATIPNAQIKSALSRFRLTIDNDQQRYIYFFDTPKGELLKAGVIARARRIVGGRHDSTVKFRPVNPSKVAKEWSNLAGFKLEADASEKGVVKSASLTLPVAKGLIKRIASGKAKIASAFSKKQSRFLQAIGGKTVDFNTLTVFGPLDAQRWEFRDAGCPWTITAELWRRGDGDRLMELSVKAPAAQAAVAIGGFMAFLAEVGAEKDVDQQAKTRWAMASRPSARPRVAPKGKSKKAAAVGAGAGRTSDRTKRRSPPGEKLKAPARLEPHGGQGESDSPRGADALQKIE